MPGTVPPGLLITSKRDSVVASWIVSISGLEYTSLVVLLGHIGDSI